jgi:AraC family transcriptional regulator
MPPRIQAMHRTDLPTEYKLRMNRVFEYLDQHLDSDLSLETVAAEAFFSPFHFHRVFKTITNETLNGYITRRRIEQSAIDLLHSDARVTEIAMKLGFSCNSAFTRTFRKFYGVSPTEFRKSNPNKYSRIRQLKSKNGQVYPGPQKYLRVIEHLKTWTTMNTRIEIRTMPRIELAYISVKGPQHLSEAYGRLREWGISKGLYTSKTKLLTIYHDSLKITEEQKARMSAGMTLSGPVAVDGEIALTAIEAGNSLVGSNEIELKDFEHAWTGLFLWMNENGYKRAEGNPFEIYHNNFNEHPERKCIVDFCIPIR